MRIPRPDTYHGNKDILQCYEALISGYLTAHQLPHHWLYSDSWGFYYQGITKFGAYPPACVYPLWRSLNRLYGVRKQLLYGASLPQLLQKVLDDGEPVFLIADQFDLPWVTEYGMIHHNHYLAVTDWHPDRRQVFVQDLWPIEYRNWYDSQVIDAAYRARGCHAFRLSTPHFEYGQDERALLAGQLHRWLAAAEGEEQRDTVSGLIGIRAFLADIAHLDDQAPKLAEQWFDMLRRVLDVRLLFLEYLSMLQRSDGEQSYGVDGAAAAVEQCIAAWHSLRNYLILSRYKRSYHPQRCIELLRKIIDREQACVREVRGLLSRVTDVTHVSRMAGDTMA